MSYKGYMLRQCGKLKGPCQLMLAAAVVSLILNKGKYQTHHLTRVMYIKHLEEVVTIAFCQLAENKNVSPVREHILQSSPALDRNIV